MFRIFGPPGTGKTTTLLNMVDKALESGVAPNQIAFFAFTRKAANEAKERAAARFGLDPKEDLFYFRTLHSFALKMTSIRPDQVMQPANYDELGKAIGVPLKAKSDLADDDVYAMASGGEPILSLINLARLLKRPLREVYNRSGIEAPWTMVSYVARALDEYKTAFDLYDFTDMLQVFVEKQEAFCPGFEMCFLDEAQDLSPLQWDVAHMLDRKSKRMYVAGDDDQAIYRWAGADVDHFINLPGGSETLSQSYRVPQQPYEVAKSVARQIQMRFPKTYLPREESGNVKRIYTTSEIDMSEGTWMILSQAGYRLDPVADELRAGGYLFTHRGSRSIPEKVSTAVNGWEQLRKGRAITGDVARTIYGYMSSGSRIARGFKKLPGLEDSDTVVMGDLIAAHGLKIDGAMIWSDAMDLMPDVDRAYVTALLRRGEKFNAVPRIATSTIHGSKGGEADNVVLFTDLSPAADAQMRLTADDMHRVFYVGVTRTKKNLFLVEPENISRSYTL